MKTKAKEELRNKTMPDLIKDIQVLSEALARMKLEHTANPAKDTNVIGKEKRKLAILKTLVREKELVQTI